MNVTASLVPTQIPYLKQGCIKSNTWYSMTETDSPNNPLIFILFDICCIFQHTNMDGKIVKSVMATLYVFTGHK